VQALATTAPRAVSGEVAGDLVRLLTEPDDLVVDIFAGSNTTDADGGSGKGGRWLLRRESGLFWLASASRFVDADVPACTMKESMGHAAGWRCADAICAAGFCLRRVRL